MEKILEKTSKKIFVKSQIGKRAFSPLIFVGYTSFDNLKTLKAIFYKAYRCSNLRKWKKVSWQRYVTDRWRHQIRKKVTMPRIFEFPWLFVLYSRASIENELSSFWWQTDLVLKASIPPKIEINKFFIYLNFIFFLHFKRR